ncbi:MAG TPA: hypothetical protein VFV58_10670, partial [Blastocatellia bacterium]|nr:hypothetical protein [Blastocatellia bacterium]
LQHSSQIASRKIYSVGDEIGERSPPHLMEEMGIEPMVTNVLPTSIRQRKFKELSETTDFTDQ